MVYQAVSWLWDRWRPAEGWLPFFLLTAATASLAAAVLEVGWVPEDGVVIPATAGGLLLGVVLAKRPLGTLPAWLLITLYALVVTTMDLARLWPSPLQWFQGWEPLRQFWLQNGALFLDRMGSWFKAAATGGTSQETIVFAFGLGVLAFLLAALGGWTIFRRHRPLEGLVAMGLALAVNSYYGAAPIWWLGAFVGLAVLLTAVIHMADLEQTWEARQVDYSDQVRIDLLLYAAGIAIFLLLAALLLPAFSITELVEFLEQQTAVQEAEDTLSRIFAGVEQPRPDEPSPGGPGGRGVMPRTYLLGNAPELQETVVMTAVVTKETAAGDQIPATPADLRGAHWRALSYDVYTGRGWAITEERREPVAAGEFIDLPPAAGQTVFRQEIDWQLDERLIRYTLGLPLRFNQDVTVAWRGLEDLARVQGAGSEYRVTTRLTTAAPDELRQTAVADVPPAVLARYTPLPEGIPQRVLDLAQEVGGSLDNPYDQARAIEQFLRQYSYSLDVSLPPEGADPVDYFLFELQTGYCDYYASAMVVLARSLGLPARLAVGFLAQPPDENGVQTVRQINGHSWAEVYFAGYGWVEFEPTRPFRSPRDPAEALEVDESTMSPPDFPEPAPPPIPTTEELRPFPWGRVGILAGLFLVGLWLWRRQQARQPAAREAVVWAYGRLQQRAAQMGQPLHPSQTPAEFETAFTQRLDQWLQDSRWPRLAQWVAATQAPIRRLTRMFEERQYADRPVPEDEVKREWQVVKRPLWLLRWLPKPDNLHIPVQDDH